MAAGEGNRWVSSPSGKGNRSSAAAVSRAAAVCAPATETCCPSIARMSISGPSTAPGPAARASSATDDSQRRVRRERRVDGDRIGVQVENSATPRNGGGEIRRVLEPDQRSDGAGIIVLREGQGDRSGSRGQPERPVVGAVPDMLNPGHRMGGQKSKHRVGSKGSRHLAAERVR